MWKRMFLVLAVIGSSVLVAAGSAKADHCYRSYGYGYGGGYPVYRSPRYYDYGPSYYHRSYYGGPSFYYGHHGYHGRHGVHFSFGF